MCLHPPTVADGEGSGVRVGTVRSYTVDRNRGTVEDLSGFEVNGRTDSEEEGWVGTSGVVGG